MPLRTRLLIIIGLIVVVIGGVIALSLKKTPASAPATETSVVDVPVVVPNTVQATEIPSGMKIAQPTTLETEQNAVRQLAKTFAERYNSFSTDNNYQNIRDVEELVTSVLWKKISARLDTPQASGAFSSATTEVLSATLADWKTDQATITLKVRKTSVQGSIKTEQYQTISVVMVKQNGQWLADSFTIEK